MKLILLSSFKKYSAIWRYAFEINKRFRNIKWLDLYTGNKYLRTIKLFGNIKDYDVLICSSPLLCNFINKNQGFNIVIVHDLYPLSVGKGVSFLEKFLYRIIYKKIKYADHLLFVSEFSRIEFQSVFGLNINNSILPAGIDHSIFRPSKEREKIRKKLGHDKFIISHVGTDEPRKNIIFVLQILEKLVKSGIDAHLLRVGDLKKKTVDYIKSKNLDEHISIFTDLDEKKLAEIYQASDVFLFPSFYEGLGLPPIEAMASGCPTIVSNKASLVEVGIDETIVELKVDKWIEKIIKIKKDFKYRDMLVKKGIEKSKNYDWEKYCGSLKKIIENHIKK